MSLPGRSFFETLLTWLQRPDHAAGDLGPREERRRLRRRLGTVRAAIAQLSAPRRMMLERRARELTGIRERIAALTGAPPCCSTCVERMEGPGSPLRGGHCCSGQPELIFSELELAVLWLGGHRPQRYRFASRAIGCVFRTPLGCSLPPARRPSLCLRYFCRELVEEYERVGVLDEALDLCEELEGAVREMDEWLCLGAGN